MDKFTFSYPTKVYFGEGSATQALDDELGKVGETVMLAYGGGSIKKNGVYDEIKEKLSQAGKQVVEFSGIMPNPTYAKVQEGSALARKNHVDFILAVGGGSVIDCCKVVSAQAMLAEDIWEMEYGKGKFPMDGIPMGAVVTASGTGAEMPGQSLPMRRRNGKVRFSGQELPLLFLTQFIRCRCRPCRFSLVLLIR